MKQHRRPDPFAPRTVATDLTARSFAPRFGVILVIVAGLLVLGGCTAGNDVKGRDGAVTGTVTDLKGNPLAGVLVQWEVDNAYYSVTDSAGRFTIEGLYFGQQVLVMSKSNYKTERANVTIYSGIMTPMAAVALQAVSFNFLDIVVSDTSATTARVTWKTTEYTNGLIQYGDSESMGSAARETAGQYKTLHEVKLEGLKPQTRYYFKIVASRENRDAESSAVSNFQTMSALQDQRGPDAPRAVTVDANGSLNQLTVTWAGVTDADLKGYRVYRTENPLSGFTAIPATIAKGSDRYTDVGLPGGKKYYYRVAALDQAGNEGGQSDIVAAVVPGDLATEVNWTRANSPYLLTGDLTITSTGKLTIDQGVEVRVTNYDALRRGDAGKVEITVGGILLATGTVDAPITFSSAQPSPLAGDWNGIAFAIEPNANSGSNLARVQVLHAQTGISVKGTGPTLVDVTMNQCQTGLRIENTSNYTVASCTTMYCNQGMVLSGNTAITLADSTAYHCARGIEGLNNTGAAYVGNNLLDCRDVGLSIAETGGTLAVSNNLFVSGTGLGLKIVDHAVTVDHNTFDTPTGIQIDKGNTTIERNIFVTTKSLNNGGVKGIEHLAGTLPLPIYSYNNLYGFPSGKDYVGCASGTWAIASMPLFLKDYGGSSYDYRLRQSFPSSRDVWGIDRNAQPF